MLKTNILRAVWQHLKRHGLCRHLEMMRIKVNGAWYYACSCGYQVPIVQRHPKSS